MASLVLLLTDASFSLRAEEPKPALAQSEVLPAAETAHIVAIGGAVTEILYALGLGERIVAVDTSSTYPPQALGTKPNVGYMRALSPEGVLAVGPSIILAQEGSGPPDAVTVLKSASVPFETVPDARTPEQVVANIRHLAALAGVKARGEELAQAVERDFATLAAFRARIASPRSAAFILSASGAAPVAGGRNTSADALFALAGVTNALSTMSGYKPAVDEALMAAEPYALIVMDNRNHGLTNEALAAMPAFAGTTAAKAGRIHRVDGAYMLGFGPRTPQAARDLMAMVYPELNLPALPAHAWTAGSRAEPDSEPPAAPAAAPAGSGQPG
ncbi:ABC transporter substrate-binding protein [Ancylobacter sp. 6x-1]|uniref:ABC transporter substrate-binding protein n=1 Tax=Ancylobacter crimeensis TaxID=2579147 RepID=A0ABT0D620_9HYPH|nr:ABC transporter substrate-binding protein [Ancylobacter crimeensis]